MMNAKIQLASEKNLEELLPFVRAYHKFEELNKALLPDEANISKRVAAACEARGLIVRPIAHLNVMSPPLILTRQQIDDMVEMLRDSVLNAARDLKKEGFLD